MNSGSDPVSNTEHHEATDSVDPEVIPRDDDAGKREERICQQYGSHPASSRQRIQAKDAPRGPSDVQRRHGGVLIRQRLTRSAIERPRPAELLDGVTEAEVLGIVVVAKLVFDTGRPVSPIRTWGVEQSRRHQGEEGKTEDRECRHRGETVPPQTEDFGSEDEQGNEYTERDEEVRGAVVHVEELDHPDVREDPLLDRFLVVETQRAFDTNDPHRVEECLDRDLATGDERRTEDVSNERVDAVEHGNDEGLLPPNGAVYACRAELRARRGLCSCGRHAKMLPTSDFSPYARRCRGGHR